jgi:hypothetical protein
LEITHSFIWRDLLEIYTNRIERKVYGATPRIRTHFKEKCRSRINTGTLNADLGVSSFRQLQDHSITRLDPEDEMNKIVRYFVYVLVLLSLVLSMAGCQQGTPAPAEPTEPPAAAEQTEAPAPEEPAEPAVEPTEAPAEPAEVTEPVTLQMWYLSQNPVEVDVVTSIVEKFEETHPGVTVEISVYGFEDMLKTLKLALDSGSGPDVAYSDPSIPNGVAYAKAGHLLDLTDAIEKYRWDERFAIATNQVVVGSLDARSYLWLAIRYDDGWSVLQSSHVR